jgi:DNA polymerase-2
MARSSPGTAISAMQAAQALRRGVLVPFRKREPEGFKTAQELVETDKGGLTYLPRPGLHENAGELDFASMYPSLMVRYNISPETMNCRCCPGDALPVPGIPARTCRRRRGLVPETIAPVLAKRALLKERQKAAADPAERETLRRRQTALKWLLVVCFGFLGYKNAHFGRIEAHEATTAWGREKLLSAKETAEREGFRLSPTASPTPSGWRRRGRREDDYGGSGRRSRRRRGCRSPSRASTGGSPSCRRRGTRGSGSPTGSSAPSPTGRRRPAASRCGAPTPRPSSRPSSGSCCGGWREARGIGELRAMLPELREAVEAKARELREGRVPPEALSISRRLSREPQRTSRGTRRRKSRGSFPGAA